jgi:hypothetical protein
MKISLYINIQHHKNEYECRHQRQLNLLHKNGICISPWSIQVSLQEIQ